MLQTPAIWSWHNQFGSDDGPGFSVSTTQCGFVAGQRGAEKLIVCDIEGGMDAAGDPVVGAVQGSCPACELPFRLDPVKTPCSVGARPVPFEQNGQMMRLRPLTVYVPVTCNAEVAAIGDEGNMIGRGVCDWRAIIRNGQALPVDHVRLMLPQAIDAARNAWSKTMQAIQLASSRNGMDYSQWVAALNGAWQNAMPAIARIQAGQYERSGPDSLVGAWDMVDHVIDTCKAIMGQLGQGGR